ncbi:hypothetical protein OC861_006115 [Tilletia horrida]|nr:hypothetical protein OC861_006115 [Tilletia horrida]
MQPKALLAVLALTSVVTAIPIAQPGNVSTISVRQETNTVELHARGKWGWLLGGGAIGVLLTKIFGDSVSLPTGPVPGSAQVPTAPVEEPQPH